MSGVQANDTGYPHFGEKCMTYPRFRKEWSAYSGMYPRHKQVELACRGPVRKCLGEGMLGILNTLKG
jgi:hypothetical protein